MATRHRLSIVRRSFPLVSFNSKRRFIYACFAGAVIKKKEKNRVPLKTNSFYQGILVSTHISLHISRWLDFHRFFVTNIYINKQINFNLRGFVHLESNSPKSDDFPNYSFIAPTSHTFIYTAHKPTIQLNLLPWNLYQKNRPHTQLLYKKKRRFQPTPFFP